MSGEEPLKDSPQPFPAVVGIDLGSLSCRLAELAPGRRMPTILRNNLSNEGTPTVAYFPAEGECRAFGESVATKDISSPQFAVADLKEWLFKRTGDTRVFAAAAGPDTDADLSAAQVAGFCLRQVLDFSPAFKALVAAPSGPAPLHVVLAAPTPFDADAAVQQAVAQAALLAGTQAPFVLRVVDEADALLAYLHHLRFESHAAEAAAAPVTVILNAGHCFTTIVAARVSKGRAERLASATVAIGSSTIDDGLAAIVFDSILKAQKKDIAGHAKSFKKVLRECRKAKEVLSSVDQATVQLEGLAEDVDVRLSITRAQATEQAKPLLAALAQSIDTVILPAIRAALGTATFEEGAVTVECVGGGWRSACLQDLIKEKFAVARVGVSLDANLCVAEGCAILGAVAAAASAAEGAEFDGIHRLELVGASPTALGDGPTAEVPAAWRAMEERLLAKDAAHHALTKAADAVEMFVFRQLDLAGRASVADAEQSTLSSILTELDELRDAGAATVEGLEGLLAKAQAAAAAIPALQAQVEKEAAEQRRKDEALAQLAKEQGEDKELKSDPQRLRVAQQRREQGTTLFKQECWEEAQTRFVQALSVLGQLYDSTGPENKAKKDEISLSCYLNIASCCVKLGRWRIAVNNCSNALDVSPNHPKALFRRGQAYSALGDFSEARADLEKAKEITSGDAGVVAELELLEQKVTHQKEKEKKMFSKMFA